MRSLALPNLIFLVIILFLSPGGCPAPATASTTPLEFAIANKDVYTQDLLHLAAIPTISALPEHADDITAAAEWLVQRLSTAGLEHVQVCCLEIL